jgi:cysteine desulfuration protein SufE
MTSSENEVAGRLARMSEEFSELEPRERLELLLEYAERLPPLPEKYRAERDAGLHRIRECQTPVFVWIELNADRVEIIADSAPEAPTVKGFVNLLREAFNGAMATDVLAVEQNLVQAFGLAELLGMVRIRGLLSIQTAVRRQIRAAVEAGAA